MQHVCNEAEERRLLASVLSGGGSERRADFAVQGALHTKPPRLVEEARHLRAQLTKALAGTINSMLKAKR
jgi:hypothetical protein